MILYQKVNMKDLLAQGLFLSMQEKPFEKITIKQICDKTGVIRGTFYNHFMDKYETLEYLVYYIFYDELKDIVNDEERLMRIFEIIYKYQDFFIKCFHIEGQNSFESILENIFKDLFLQTVGNIDWQKIDKIITVDFFVSYYIHAIIYILKYWIDHQFKQSSQEIHHMTMILFSNSLKEIL